MPKGRKSKTNRKKSVNKAVETLREHFWDHFVPHEGNDHVPHVLKHHVLFGYSVIILLLKVVVFVTPIMLPSASVFSSAITASNVILLTNQTRLNLGLHELAQNSALMAAAQAKALDMLNNQYFAHYSPDGLSPWFFIKREGYAYERAGENLAVHYTTAEGVHDGWLASPAHRANIVKEEFSEIGVGVVNGEFEGNPSTIVVQLFGKPKVAVAETGPALEESKVVEQKEEEAQVIPVADISNDVDRGEGEAMLTQADEEEVGDALAESAAVANIIVKPTEEEGVYEVKVPMGEAESMGVQMGSKWVALEKDEEEEIWKGEVAGALTYDKAGEAIQLIAQDKTGKIISQTALLAAPGLSVQDFFIFSDAPTKQIKLFGIFEINNLEDDVKRFYVYFMVFLGAALTLKILIKIQHQKVSVIAHACFVLGFAFILFLI